MTEEIRQRLNKISPQGRVGQSEDAAHLISFLASPNASWITGQVIHSHGGM